MLIAFSVHLIRGTNLKLYWFGGSCRSSMTSKHLMELLKQILMRLGMVRLVTGYFLNLMLIFLLCSS